MTPTVQLTPMLGRMLRRTALACSLGAVLAGCGGSVEVPKGPPRAFDSTAWKAQDAVTSAARFHMIDDLLKQHELVGMSIHEVEKLLGEANRWGDPELDGHEWHIYYLGWTELHDPLMSEPYMAALNIQDDGDSHVGAYKLYPRPAFPNQR